MIDYVAIGRRIKKQRKKCKISQSLLAEKINVSVNYISKIECGRTKISLTRLDEIAGIIEISLESLIIGSSTASTDYFSHELSELIKDWPPSKRQKLYSLIEFYNNLP